MSVPTLRWDRLNFALKFKAFPRGSQLYPMHPQVCDILGTACCLWWDGPKSIPTHSHLSLPYPNLGCVLGYLGRHDKQFVTFQDLSQLTPISLCLIPTLGVSWEDMTSRLRHFKICPNSLPSLFAWSQPWMCLGKTWQAGCDISRSVPTHSHLSLPDPNLGCVLGRHDKQIATFQDLSQLTPISLCLFPTLGVSWEDMTSRLWHFETCPNSDPSSSILSQIVVICSLANLKSIYYASRFL